MEALALLNSVASIIVAIVAALALYLAWRQIGVSRELSGLEAYENYHAMCLQYSEYTSGNVSFADFDEDKLRHYEIYVLYTLMMDERIFALFRNDPGWLFSIKDDIRMHRDFIASPGFAEHLENQQWNILPIIHEVLAESSRVQTRPSRKESSLAEEPRTNLALPRGRNRAGVSRPPLGRG